MLRSVLGALALATAVGAAAPAPAAPSPAAAPTAAQRTDPLAGLTVHPEWGSIRGQRGVLKKGCRRYRYSYALTPPEGIWAVEVYISGPRRTELAAGAFLDGYDPLTGTGSYTLCRNTTRYGRFTIRAKVSVDDGAGHITEGQLPPDTFRLHRPRRGHR